MVVDFDDNAGITIQARKWNTTQTNHHLMPTRRDENVWRTHVRGMLFV